MTSRLPSSPSCASGATELALAARQGPADPPALAADRRAADRLPGGPRRADRLRAVGRQLQAARRLPERDPGVRHPAVPARVRQRGDRSRHRPRPALLARRMRRRLLARGGRAEGPGRRRDRSADPAAGSAGQAPVARQPQPAAADGRGARQPGRPGEGQPGRRPDPGPDHGGEPAPLPADLRPGLAVPGPADQGRARQPAADRRPRHPRARAHEPDPASGPHRAAAHERRAGGARPGGQVLRPRSPEPRLRAAAARRGRLADQGRQAGRRGAIVRARRVRDRGRRDDHADVRHGPAGRGLAGARARGERLRPAHPRPGRARPPCSPRRSCSG